MACQIDPWVTNARDPFKATDAASIICRTWYSASAASIWRPRPTTRVPAASSGRSAAAGGTRHRDDQTFFEIADRRNLRRETRDYVPKLIAAALIAKQPSRYGFTDIDRLPPLVFDEVSVPDATGLDVLARLADTSVAALLELNPSSCAALLRRSVRSFARVPRGRGVACRGRYADLPSTSA